MATAPFYEVHWTFSRQGRPYIELIQGQGDDLFSLAHESNVWFADPSRFRGIRIELVNEDTRNDFEAWLASPA